MPAPRLSTATTAQGYVDYMSLDGWTSTGGPWGVIDVCHPKKPDNEGRLPARLPASEGWPGLRLSTSFQNGPRRTYAVQLANFILVGALGTEKRWHELTWDRVSRGRQQGAHRAAHITSGQRIDIDTHWRSQPAGLGGRVLRRDVEKVKLLFRPRRLFWARWGLPRSQGGQSWACAHVGGC